MILVDGQRIVREVLDSAEDFLGSGHPPEWFCDCGICTEQRRARARLLSALEELRRAAAEEAPNTFTAFDAEAFERSNSGG